jgi:hypothetical protein
MNRRLGPFTPLPGPFVIAGDGGSRRVVSSPVWRCRVLRCVFGRVVGRYDDGGGGGVGCTRGLFNRK